MKLVLGDDQAIFLDALATVLMQHGYEVGAVARSPEEMIAHVRHQRPDTCLIDCNLAVDDGIETIRATIEASAATTVVVLSADPGVESAELALQAGASAYLHQSRGVEVLVSALERVLNGERVVDVPAGAGRRPRETSQADHLAAALTGRERECLNLLVAGLDTAGMMQRLGVSRTTVRTHLQAVLTKLGVHSRLEAASFAVRHHLVEAWAEPAGFTPASPAVPATAGSRPSPDLAPRRPAADGRGGRRTGIHAVGHTPQPASSRPPVPAWGGPSELARSG
jgi:two-component system, NarL family, nitrate/nitrite response regulator NarL